MSADYIHFAGITPTVLTPDIAVRRRRWRSGAAPASISYSVDPGLPAGDLLCARGGFIACRRQRYQRGRSILLGDCIPADRLRGGYVNDGVCLIADAEYCR